jgi:hypothetical protein
VEVATPDSYPVDYPEKVDAETTQSSCQSPDTGRAALINTIHNFAVYVLLLPKVPCHRLKKAVKTGCGEIIDAREFGRNGSKGTGVWRNTTLFVEGRIILLAL